MFAHNTSTISYYYVGDFGNEKGMIRNSKDYVATAYFFLANSDGAEYNETVWIDAERGGLDDP